MLGREFWKAVIEDRSDFLDSLFVLLDTHDIRYCVVGGQAVNAYAEPLVSLDLDVAIASEDLSRAEALVGAAFHVDRFPHSLNVSAPGSSLRLQIQTDPRYASFPERATTRDVLGFRVPVAALEDVLQDKIWAATDSERRRPKRRRTCSTLNVCWSGIRNCARRCRPRFSRNSPEHV